MEDISYKILKSKKCLYMKWPGDFSCNKCQCHKYWLIKRVSKTKVSYVLECKKYHKLHSLLSDTIFQSYRLDLYKLLLDIFLISIKTRE